MKVFIGPYPKSYKKERKINIRIDNYDTWNMDDTLARIILPMLVQLKKSKHGAPNTDDEDAPKNLRSTAAPAKEKEYDIDANHFKRWDWILNEMAWAFSEHTKDWEKKFHSGKRDTLWQALDKDRKPIGKPTKRNYGVSKKIEGAEWFEMIKGPKDTHEFDVEGYKKHLARIRNGFRLFGKYYMNLWD